MQFLSFYGQEYQPKLLSLIQQAIGRSTQLEHQQLLAFALQLQLYLTDHLLQHLTHVIKISQMLK
jgi:hypothetical protein